MYVCMCIYIYIYLGYVLELGCVGWGYISELVRGGGGLGGIIHGDGLGYVTLLERGLGVHTDLVG